jgi:heparosan-N-sulfate-glucuronate 5-epimerase
MPERRPETPADKADSQTRLRWLPGSARGFDLPSGPRTVSPEHRGYYIDFRSKATRTWWRPKPWSSIGARVVWVALIQWGLGCYERYLAGDGEQWRSAALEAGGRLVDDQQREGRLAGGWVHTFPLAHTYPLRPPWLSSMAQGEAASFLLRLLEETGDERFALPALRALEPMGRPTTDGGVRATLAGGFFPEEYPTDPPSYVLNGAIFALWGCHDVADQLGDDRARALFEDGSETLARSIDRYDTGYWSRYDLFPHRVDNVASPAYHDLHIAQLRALAGLTARPEFAAAAAAFEGYGMSYATSLRALAHKAVFRVAVPRNPALASVLPWARRH